MEFAGWKAHRDCDDAWFVIDAAGNGRWAKLDGGAEIDRIFRASLKDKPADGDGGALPEGWSFYR